MPRGRRVAPGGLAYHVLNREAARLALFEKDADYEAFATCALEGDARNSHAAVGLLRPRDWSDFVNRSQSAAETTAFRRFDQRGTPFGFSQGQVRTATRFGLKWTIRPRG
jgi:hypothetical protein